MNGQCGISAVHYQTPARRQARQPGDMDAVGSVGRPGLDLVQEDHVALPFLDPHGVTRQTLELRRQGRQFVIVGREQRPTLVSVV